MSSTATEDMLVREKVGEILAAWWQQVLPEEMLP